MNNKKFFDLIHQDSQSSARAGIIHTQHSDIETPVFMPVGTQGTVKAIEQRELEEIGAQILLSNTYHLYLRPGSDVLQAFGGLHKFMNWHRPILTDSGGYQVFSLTQLRKLKPEGVIFHSHIDGSEHIFTPEKVVEIQRLIGSDIMMVLDECTPYPADEEYIKQSNEISLNWAKRSRFAFEYSSPLYNHQQFQFGICQGGIFPYYRKEYIKKITDIDFDGFAIGGVSVGEPKDKMYEIAGLSASLLPADKPRYLMGVGMPEDILEAISMGIDMFDCVIPTRNARNAQLFTTRGKINIRNAKYRFSKELIDENIQCYASQNFTLGYLRHLFISNEILGLQLASFHNVAFFLWMVNTAREKILNNEFNNWKNDFLYYYQNNS
ncbi:MAG TPA: tRNA guanosine(34) transglycosylase Tgt [Bacteroidota bacterium]|nr:tRNA guanosine(34) transglycosylase Tgt [Bacteroidota bacterium]